MKVKLLITILLIFTTTYLIAQEDLEHKSHKHHKHQNNELGIGNSMVYFMKAKEFSYGLHLHYIHYLAHTKFGVGVGYERIFDEHKHNTFGIIGTYSPVDRFYISLSPGVTFEDNSSELNFAMHFETTYEFELGSFHIGPVLSYAFDPEDYHFGLGVHLGYGF